MNYCAALPAIVSTVMALCAATAQAAPLPAAAPSPTVSVPAVQYDSDAMIHLGDTYHLRGHVRVRRGAETVSSDRAVVDLGSHTVLFSGNVLVSGAGGANVRARTVYLDIRSGRFRMPQMPPAVKAPKG